MALPWHLIFQIFGWTERLNILKYHAEPYILCNIIWEASLHKLSLNIIKEWNFNEINTRIGHGWIRDMGKVKLFYTVAQGSIIDESNINLI